MGTDSTPRPGEPDAGDQRGPDAEGGPSAERGQDAERGPSVSGGARQFSAAAASSMRTREDGSLDVMQSIGGVRGLLEASLPAAGFLLAFVISEDLTLAIVLAVALSLVFTVVRLAQRGTLVQALSGLVGIVICAFVAYRTGEARDFYALGFITNAAYLAAFAVSIAVRWPFLGLLFGLVRGEGLSWRSDRVRRRRYAMATWLLSAVLLARLAVQVPLYLADELAALGIARLVMGLPLYALALWWGWMLTRPPAAAEAQR